MSVGASEGEREFLGARQRVAWRRGLENGLAKQPGEIVPYRILPAAIDAVKKVAGSRLKLFSEGRTK